MSKWSRDGPPAQWAIPGTRKMRLHSDTFSRAAVGFGKGLVVAESIERREPRIAVAMEEDEFAAVAGEGCQVGGRRLDQRIADQQRGFIDIKCP